MSEHEHGEDGYSGEATLVVDGVSLTATLEELNA